MIEFVNYYIDIYMLLQKFPRRSSKHTDEMLERNNLLEEYDF